MNEKDDNYQVGYGRPPRHTRFQKGRSGNPRGRPRGSRNSSTLVKQALFEQVEVRESGRLRRISKLEAIITQAVNKAATGDHRARDFLFNKVPWLQKELAEPRSPAKLDEDGQRIPIETIRLVVERVEAARAIKPVIDVTPVDATNAEPAELVGPEPVRPALTLEDLTKARERLDQ